MKRINNLEKIGEKSIPKKYTNEEDYLIYLRHLFASTYGYDFKTLGALV